MKLSTDLPFVIASEAVPGFGEDSYFLRSAKGGISAMGVFDGCGGIGCRRYSAANNRTGAWIGSQTAAFAADAFIAEGKFVFTKHSANELEKYISKKLSKTARMLEDSEPETDPSIQSKSLPTSLSIIAVQHDDTDELLCEFLWAGDSRGYILDSAGLCQLTVDDIDINAGDAYDSLQEESILTNMANGDGSFELHSGLIKLGTPAFLISATDGCFDAFLTPMDLEYAILESLTSADTPDRWISNLGSSIKEVSGDDITMTIGCYGFDTFVEMKGYFAKRLEQLKAIYISKEHNASDEELKRLWNSYKPSYYRYKLTTDF